MKKYKLIKTYPGWDNLGEVLFSDKKGYYRECMPFINIPHYQIENYPDFWEEVKEPLIFTTEDGVDITDPVQVVCGLDSFSLDVKWCILAEGVKLYEDVIWFSSEAARTEYTIMNKPLFSINDLKDINTSSDFSESRLLDLSLTTLIQIASKKLKDI